MKLRVIKVGGSLCSWQGLGDGIRGWLAAHSVPPATNLLVVGGGTLVDVVRDWDETHRLSEAFSHWTSIRLLRTTTQLVHELCPELTLLETPEQLQQFVEQTRNSSPTSSRAALVQAAAYYGMPGQPTLPESWDVTSDSLAALLAGQLDAEELVLLKSCAAAGDSDSLEAWSQAGGVDPQFSSLVHPGCRVRWVNLRAFDSEQIINDGRR